MEGLFARFAIRNGITYHSDEEFKLHIIVEKRSSPVRRTARPKAESGVRILTITIIILPTSVVSFITFYILILSYLDTGLKLLGDATWVKFEHMDF